jgi:hypothetical protein
MERSFSGRVKFIPTVAELAMTIRGDRQIPQPINLNLLIIADGDQDF